MSELPRSDMEHDAKLTALYRAAAQDGPPPALDDAIRAVAHRAAASKPRLAGSPFSRSWRVPLSIAAVLVLSVSVVTLMREESPEMTRPPRVESSLPQPAARDQPAETVPAAEGQAAAVPKTTAPTDQQPSGLGLKASSSSADGLRSDLGSPASARSKKDAAAAGRMEPQAPPAPSPAKEAAPEAFPGAAAMRDNRIARPVEQARPAQEEARREIAAAEAQRPLAASGESKALAKPEGDSSMREPERARAQIPAAKPAVSPPPSPAAAVEKRVPQTLGMTQSYVNQPPEKWLEQIQLLRNQGRLEEARASFADFRKRYPDYPLPPALKEWAKP